MKYWFDNVLKEVLKYLFENDLTWFELIWKWVLIWGQVTNWKLYAHRTSSLKGSYAIECCNSAFCKTVCTYACKVLQARISVRLSVLMFVPFNRRSGRGQILRDVFLWFGYHVFLISFQNTPSSRSDCKCGDWIYPSRQVRSLSSPSYIFALLFLINEKFMCCHGDLWFFEVDFCIPPFIFERNRRSFFFSFLGL